MPDVTGPKGIRKPATIPGLVNVTSTGPGPAKQLGGGFSTFSIQVFRGPSGSSGTSTSVSVFLQGCNNPDSGKWYTIGATTITINSTAGSMVSRNTTFGPVSWVRMNVRKFSTAGSAPKIVPISAYIACSGA